RVLIRTLSDPDGSWCDEIVVPDPAEMSMPPAMAAAEERFFAGYETGGPKGPRTVEGGKFDSGGTVEREVVAPMPSHTGLAVRLHAERGHVWVDWIESSSSMG